jgi:Phospholipid-translocating P-type ATPase C-terminal
MDNCVHHSSRLVVMCLCAERRRFLVRLLLVHGSLSVYRLARLIKYSFYKNITLAFLLFMLQPFGGWSGAHMRVLHAGRGSPRHLAPFCPPCSRTCLSVLCHCLEYCVLRALDASDTRCLRHAGQAMLDGITASFINAFFVSPKPLNPQATLFMARFVGPPLPCLIPAVGLIRLMCGGVPGVVLMRVVCQADVTTCRPRRLRSPSACSPWSTGPSRT